MNRKYSVFLRNVGTCLDRYCPEYAKPFNDACNVTGIISGGKILNAIAEAYEKPPETGMPGRCEAIYLTLEIFGGTADLPVDIEYKIKDSAAY